MNKKRIAARLKEHLLADGTMNDGATDALYREWHGIPEGAETDLEAVERWASQVANDCKCCGDSPCTKGCVEKMCDGCGECVECCRCDSSDPDA